MPIVVNSNTTATTASFNLSHANDALRKSIARLSSGKRIVNPADDAGGMAVAYKLESALKRTDAVRQNVQNGISFLQVQDGALATVGKILDRMAELRTMASDITKSSSDIANYSKEFVELQSQLGQVRNQKFNGIDLFAVQNMQPTDFAPVEELVHVQEDITHRFSELDPNDVVQTRTGTYDKYSFQIRTHESGLEKDGSVSLNVVNLEFILSLGGTYTTAGLNLGGFGMASATSTNNDSTDPTLIGVNGTQFIADITHVSIASFTRMIEKLADARAENGAEQNRLSMVSDLLGTNMTNLEAAHGRIMDADIALESTRMARQNVLVQSSAAMVAQANQLTSIALTVLG